MRRQLPFAIIISILCVFFACEQAPSGPPTDLTQTAFIPQPSTVTAAGGRFTLNAKTKIYVPSEQKNLVGAEDLFAKDIQLDSGLELVIEETAKEPTTGIYLHLSENNAAESGESYQINISNKLIDIQAPDQSGLYMATQTFRQLLPPAEVRDQIEIPTGTISDQAQYGYRGVMLDVARHFFAVKDVKHYIDLASMYKMNVLHLHLSDDQGWRIEIKSWPKLTEIGGSTQVGGGQGGFYTQEEYKDIVAHAASRHMTIIPEIDMPGHTNAALASYPELNCNGKAPDLYTGTEVGFSTLCTDKEVTYQFIDDVIRELADMTPGPYIHIGGDESLVTKKEDYIPFVERVNGIVRKYNKTMVGWEEVAQAALDKEAVVHFWTNPEHAREADEKGLRMIYSPAPHTYLDMQYDSTTRLGLHWAAYIEVDDAYNWTPSEVVPEIDSDLILGIEGPLWSETIITMDDIEYMAFPRLLCLAEIGWNGDQKAEWDAFAKRLAQHGPRMSAHQIDFYPSKQVSWAQ